jgi:site-specific DNA-methyltransferase (cytosine-N4-specific)
VQAVEWIRSQLEGFDWTQKGQAFGEVTHSIHKYPAKLIPQIPGLFISKFCKTGDTVLDPYCGSGTTLLEAKRRGVNSIGFDLNPLALFISEMKTKSIKITEVKIEIKRFKRSDFSTPEKEEYILDLPQKEAEKYFPPRTVLQINHFLHLINEFRASKDTISILRLALSDILRYVSFTRMGDFKIYMIPKEERDNWEIKDIVGEFKNRIDDIFEQLSTLKRETFRKVPDSYATAIEYDSSSNNPLPKDLVGIDKVKMVVTSPPYGDSRTTVAYGEFSWFSNRILQLYSKVKQGTMDKELMGGRKIKTKVKDLGELPNVLKEIHRKRRVEVEAFFHEYQKSMSKVTEILQPGGICCYVVANRNVDGQVIPMDEFTKLYFEDCGLVHVGTYTRDITRKRLARRNNKTDLMNKEIIVVMYKPLSP